MTSRDFCFWLQGSFELSDTDELTVKQVKLIKKHLNMVFKHEIDPSMGDEKHQNELNEIHSDIKPSDSNFSDFGPKPSPKHVLGLHGWYDPNDGLILRC